MLIGPFLIAVYQFSGSTALCTYAATIFKESGSTINPNYSAIVMGVNQLIGTIFASTVVDRMGRKSLLLISSAGSTLFIIVTGVYCYLHTYGYDVSFLTVLPIISLSGTVVVSSIGMLPIPLVIVSEVLPQKVTIIFEYI